MATPAHTTQTWRFGVFEVDAHKEELRRAGVPIKMREQPLRILVFLLEHAGEIVTREELRRVLWPADTFVDFDHSLNTAVMKLREVLGDTADKPLYIETIPKRGYRFIAPVSLAMDLQNNNVGSSVDSAAPRTSGESGVPQAAGAPALVPGGRPRIERFVGAVVGLVLLVGAGLLIYIRTLHDAAPAKDGRASTSFQIVPVTSAPGVAGTPAISPDGREIAYIWDRAGLKRPEMYVLMIGSETPLRITDGGGYLGDPTWSPDGDVIAFTRCEGKEGAVYLVPALGGKERRLTSIECLYNWPSPLAWTRDGARILMIDRCSANGPFGLALFSLDTGEKRCLPDVGPIDFRGFAFSLSPDGGTVAFIPSPGLCEVYTIPISGGAPHRLVKDDHPCCLAPPMWTPDGKSIVFWSSRTTLSSLWRVMATGGEMQRETLYPATGSFSKDGRRFVYADSITNEPSAIWRADLGSAGGQALNNRKLISTQYGDLDAQPSADGSRIVWMSFRTGSAEIWASDATGENPLQLTHLRRYSGTPRWSQDGKWIAFDSYTEPAQIFVVDSEGRNLRAITGGPHPNVVPSWSRDGKWIYFASDRTGSMEVWKHSVEDDKELQLTKHGGFNPLESYDRQSVYFSKFDEAGIWSVPSQGGTESLVVAGKPQLRYWGYWAITKTGLYLLDAEVDRRSRIEFYDFATRRIVPVLTLENPAIYQPGLSATADGKTIYYAQWDGQSVIKMMEFSK